jgi:hypothetical protein
MASVMAWNCAWLNPTSAAAAGSARLLTLALLPKVIAEHRRERREVPRAASGSRLQSPFIPQVRKAAQYFVVNGACRIHHVHNVARFGIA